MLRARAYAIFALFLGILLVGSTGASACCKGGEGRCGKCCASLEGASEAADATGEAKAEDAPRQCRRGRGQGMGQGQGHGQGGARGQGQARGGQKGRHGGPPERMAEVPVLVHGHDGLRREVEEIPGGIRSVTTSDDPELVATLKEHVRKMKQVVESGGRVRQWDPLFVALFDHADEIELQIREREDGVEVVETSDNPEVVALIRAHARKVDRFVAEGPPAAHEPTPLPDTASSD